MNENYYTKETGHRSGIRLKMYDPFELDIRMNGSARQGEEYILFDCAGGEAVLIDPIVTQATIETRSDENLFISFWLSAYSKSGRHISVNITFVYTE